MQEGNLSWAASVILISTTWPSTWLRVAIAVVSLIIGFAPTGRAAAMMM